MNYRRLKFLVAAAVVTAGLTAVAIPNADAATAPAHSATSKAPSMPGMVIKTHVGPNNVITATICAHTNTSYCADVEYGNNTAGAKIWLYHDGTDYKWVLSSYVCNNGGGTCYFFEDAQNTSLCMTDVANGTSIYDVKLEGCSYGGGWYNQGNYKIGNDDRGQGGDLSVQSVGNNSYLYGYNGYPYTQWWVPGFN